MCLIAFAIDVSERWPLLVAANRDESFERPTLPLSIWTSPSGQEIASGRDVRAGGTWLGLTATGRIAFLTNVRNGFGDKLAAAKSRGELVTQWLEGQMDAAGFMAQTNPASYGGFNLVLGDWQTRSWTWLSNLAPVNSAQNNSLVSGQWRSQTLSPGLYGLSNAALDTSWPKTLALKQAMRDALGKPGQRELEGCLWEALASRDRAAEEHLPQTGVPPAIERALSSAFIEMPERAYGTRSSTLVLAQPSIEGLSLDVHEKTFAPAPADGTEAARQTGFVSLAVPWWRHPIRTT